MNNSQPNNSFSWGDALFLYLERPGQPLSIASVSLFEGKLPLKACRDLVESKLPLIPRYRQRVAFSPFNIGLPHWEFDPNFDIRNHIRQVTLRNGTEKQLKALASDILSTHLDRQRPLWDITLVQGLEGGRTGMIARIHHCLADGISGLAIMNVLMETTPEPQPVVRIKRAKEAPPKRDASSLLDSLVKSYSSAVKGALALQSEAMQLAKGVLASSGEQLSDVLAFMPEIAAPAERLQFNVICHGPQKFGWTEISLPEIKDVKQRCGGTVNDVLLSVVAAALRRYSELHGVKMKGRSARIMIPVNVRGNSDRGELGNRISFVPVTVPLDIRDPQKLFAFVRQRTEHLKRVHAAELVGFAGGLFSAIPAPILAAIGPIASQLPLSLCNMICTNIPGPQMPLYLLGHKMLSWYPYVPIGGEMGFNCAILTYNGKAYFGFSCDVGAVPDPENLEKFVELSFAELRKSAQHMKPQEEPAPPPQTSEVTAQRATRERAGRIIPLKTPSAVPPNKRAAAKPARRARVAKRMPKLAIHPGPKAKAVSVEPETAAIPVTRTEHPVPLAAAGD